MKTLILAALWPLYVAMHNHMARMGLIRYCSDAPDNSGLNQAALDNAALSKEALDFYKQVFADTQPQRDATQARANAVSDAQLSSMQLQDTITKDLWDYQKGTYRPLEQGLVADAQAYDTPDRREQEAGQAVADVNTQLGNARDALAARQASRGVMGVSGNSEALDRSMAVSGAAAAASAANQARKGVELQGYARKMDAASLGRNLSSSQATSAGVALQQGNSAVANSGTANATSQSGTNLMQQGFNTAIQGNQSAGNLYGQAAQIQLQSDKTSDLMGGLAGIGKVAALYAGSDENIKENIKPVSDEEALSQVAKVDSQKRWSYKLGAGLGTEEHTGPMAQDVQKVMGDKAAPGGKVIDLVTLNGKNMAATRALNKKVDQLADQVKNIASRRGVMAA
jgi:Chaperone of endosialidase